jgi:hypothetical protein
MQRGAKPDPPGSLCSRGKHCQGIRGNGELLEEVMVDDVRMISQIMS